MDETSPQTQTREPLRRPVRAVQRQEEKKERIKMWMAVLMGVVALFVYGFQIILTFLLVGIIAEWVIIPVAYLAFWIWFKILGVSFVSNPKKLAWFGLPSIAEFIGLPGILASVISTIIITMAEDKGGMLGKVAGAAQGKIKI